MAAHQSWQGPYSAMGQKQTPSTTSIYVCYWGQSGRSTHDPKESAYSHNRKFGTADHYIDLHITLG